jgi:hemerythrin superfamily protein
VRSISEQTDDELGGSWSVLVRQKRDHVELDRLLDDLAVTSGRDQDVVLRRLARLVFPHAFAEEAVLWPAVRRSLPEGRDLTLRVEQEHQEINELWLRLEAEQLPVADRQQVVDRIIEVLREDVRDEEDVLLPRLQESVDEARLRRLGVAWEVVRRAAPTRPHPVVSRRPVGNVLAALPLTVLDRSRDRLDAAVGRAPEAASVHGAASRAIARLSARLEHLPPLRRGEDPSTQRVPVESTSERRHA